MNVLAIDVGSSSVKAGLLRERKLLRTAHVPFETCYAPSRAEVEPDAILAAVVRAVRELGPQALSVDAIALDAMAASWVAMDRRGKPITPVVTHQDRRSVAEAVEIERRVGEHRYLRLSGNRPVPGGISSTTCLWFLKHRRSLMRRADLVGHVQTYLHRQLCGVRVADPSNASFMGLYSTTTLAGWNDELCDAVGVSPKLLPEIRDANEIAGKLLPDPARRLGLVAGTPVLVGMVDTGCAMMLAGARVGQMVNVVGSTDVLALCTDKPRQHERLLLRGLGVGRKWVSVGTIAAAGTSLTWARQQLFADLSERSFFKLVSELAKRGQDARGTVQFDPYLSGDRCSVEQRQGGFSGLTLSTTREHMLAAIVDALARASAARLDLLRKTGTRMSRAVLISGGGDGALAQIMHRDWPGGWRFKTESQATLRGLAVLAQLTTDH